ncbi:hypothetical protein EYV94_10610 [Puteibacter caeruleilacunae]|nr:hypothetical protein EYV94_10610 [Puteibacter caeruleilacunae]
MGKIAQGAFGGVSGTVGNLVGSSWKGIDYFRIKADHYHDAHTEPQVNQRNRFSGILGMCSLLREEVINPIWKHKAVQMTPSNLFTQVNMQAFGDDGNVGDWSLLKLTVGTLPIPFNMKIADNPDTPKTIDVSWSTSQLSGKKREDDQLMLILTDGKGDWCMMTTLEAYRKDEEASIMLPYEPGMTVHVYAFFASPKLDRFSESFHTEVVLS